FDGTSFSAAATVTLAVTPVNHPPTASDASFNVTEESPLLVSAPGVLANAMDADGDPVSAVLVSGPLHGTLTLNADGSCIYTQSPLYHGPDSFTYRVFDGSAFSSAHTASLDVTPVNHAPFASGDSFAIAEDVTLTVAVPGVLANDTDIDGDPISAIVFS